MHKKHGGGHNIYKYGTPGVAFDFIGDNSTMVAACREGQLFLNLYAAFCEGIYFLLCVEHVTIKKSLFFYIYIKLTLHTRNNIYEKPLRMK